MITSLFLLLAAAPAQEQAPAPRAGYQELLARTGGVPEGLPDVRGAVTLWACGDTVRVNPVTGRYFEDRDAVREAYPDAAYRRKNRIWDAETNRIRLIGARNEFVAFQAVVECDAPARGFSLRLDRLAGPGGAEIEGRQIALFKAWYANVVRTSTGFEKTTLGTGWYPDALLPVPAGKPLGFDLPSAHNAVPGQKNQSVWIDLFIPRDREAAPPGTYTGTLTVAWPGGKKDVSVELEVRDFALPEEVHCRGDIYNTTLKRMDPGLELRYYQMTHRHRFQPGVAHYRPAVKIDGTKVTIDWASYDRRVRKYLDGTAFTEKLDYWGPGRGVPLSHILLPFDIERGSGRTRAWPIATPSEGRTADYEAIWLDAARQVKAHFETDAVLKRVRKVVFIDGLDESYNEEAYRKMKYYSELLRKGLGKEWFQFRIDGGYSRSAMDFLHPYIDLWICHTAGWDNDKMAHFREKGVETWFYGPTLYEARRNSGSGSNTYTDLDLLTCRVLGWAAWKYKSGYCQWEFDAFWDEVADNFDARSNWTQAGNFRRRGSYFNGSGMFIYRGSVIGSPDPIPSIRLKAHRRGFQDYEYFWMLAKKTGSNKAPDRQVDSVVVKPPFGPASYGVLDVWKTNPDAWDAVRDRTGALLSPE